MSQPPKTQFASVTTADVNATIVVSGTTSGALDLVGTFLVGLIVPDNFDGTQIQFLGSRSGDIDSVGGLESYVPIYNASGTRLTVTATAATLTGIALTPSDFAMWRFIKLVSVTTQTVTPTVIGLVTRPIS